MTAPCFYHPDQAAVDNCVQCGSPICANCRETISGKSVCHKCVGTMRARLEREMAANPAATSGPTYGAPPGRPMAPPVAHNPNALVMGLVAGTLIGLIGAIITEKIYFYGHFGLSLLYIAVGYGIGWGIHRFTGRGGPGLALTAVGIMVACLVVSHLVLAADFLNAAKAAGNADPGVTVADAFPQVIGQLGIMHWVCILFGLGACYRGVEAQGG